MRRQTQPALAYFEGRDILWPSANQGEGIGPSLPLRRQLRGDLLALQPIHPYLQGRDALPQSINALAWLAVLSDEPTGHTGPAGGGHPNPEIARK